MTACVRCYVSGQVQGVGFRASARLQAERLGVRGYARNLRDGRVEVLMCGDPERLEAFRAWLHDGPGYARVKNLNCEEASETPPEGFAIR